MAGAEVVTCGDDGNQMHLRVRRHRHRTRPGCSSPSATAAACARSLAVRRFLRLVPGEGGAIAAERVAELAAIVAAHARTAREHGVVELHVVATAAIRAARQPRRAVRGRAARRRRRRRGPHRRGGGARSPSPARLATLASPPAGTIGVIDVGGGSSELVTGTAAEGVTWWRRSRSAPASWPTRHLRSDPPTPPSSPTPRAEVDAGARGVDPPATDARLAVGGSATSLRRPCGGELVAGDASPRILAVLLAEPAAEAAQAARAARRARAPAAGGAAAARGGLARRFGGRPLQIARGGLREGVVLATCRRCS